MMFEKVVRIPHERVAVLIGRRGSVKSQIERRCGVAISVDGETGEVMIRASDESGVGIGIIKPASQPDTDSDIPFDHTDAVFAPFKAVEIVLAIGRGFAPDAAMTLLKGDNTLHVIGLSEFAGKSRSGIERVKGRIIGERGRARRNMEQLSGTKISVYGKTVSIIGSGDNLRRATDAVMSISKGSMHGTVYGRLESANRRKKQERMLLWENDNITGKNTGGGMIYGAD